MSSLSILRIVSLAEGFSYLVLLYFAYYHKRVLGDADAIRVPGIIHGVLFILFCLALVYVWADRHWNWQKVALAFACALIPLGAIYLEKKLKAESTER